MKTIARFRSHASAKTMLASHNHCNRSRRILLGSRFLSDHSSFDKLFNFKPAIQEDGSFLVNKYEGFPEYNTEFSLNRKPQLFDPTIEVGRALLNVGKVNYKFVTPHSLFFEKKHAEITMKKSPEQIRRITKKWALESGRDKDKEFAFKGLGWTNTQTAQEPKTGNQELDKKPFDAEDVIVYANNFMPARYAVAKRILKEVKQLLPNFSPSRVLDYGCGPGTCLPAALEAFDAPAFPMSRFSKAYKVLQKASQDMLHQKGQDEQQAHERDTDEFIVDRHEVHARTIKEYIGVDNNPHMLTAAKQMASSAGVTARFLPSLTELLDLLKHYDHQQQQQRSPGGERFDLIMASHIFTELKDDVARKAVAQLLVEMLNVNGVLVILEEGGGWGNHTVRTARQFILDAFNNSSSTTGNKEKMVHALPRLKNGNNDGKEYDHDELGVSVVAPCTHDLPCPLGKGKLCLFSQKTHSGMIRLRSEEQFSYVVLQRTHKPTQQTYVHRKSALFREVASLNKVDENEKDSKGDRPKIFNSDLWVNDHAHTSSDDEGTHPTSDGERTIVSPNPLHLIQEMLVAANKQPSQPSESAPVPHTRTYTHAQRTPTEPARPPTKELHSETAQTKALPNQTQHAGLTESSNSHIPPGFEDLDVWARRIAKKLNRDQDNHNIAEGNRDDLDDDDDDEYDDDDELDEDFDDEEEDHHDEDYEDDDDEEDDDEYEDDEDSFEEDHRHDTDASAAESQQRISYSQTHLSKRQRKMMMQADQERQEYLAYIRRKHPKFDELLEDMEVEIDWSNYKPDMFRQEWSRVVGEARKSENKVSLDVCHPSGTLRRQEFTSTPFVKVPSIYEALRRVTWGGLFPAFGVNLNAIQHGRKDTNSPKVVQELSSPLSRAARGAVNTSLSASNAPPAHARQARQVGGFVNKHATTQMSGKHAHMSAAGGKILNRVTASSGSTRPVSLQHAPKANTGTPTHSHTATNDDADIDSDTHASEDDFIPSVPVSIPPKQTRMNVKSPSNAGGLAEMNIQEYFKHLEKGTTPSSRWAKPAAATGNMTKKSKEKNSDVKTVRSAKIDTIRVD